MTYKNRINERMDSLYQVHERTLENLGWAYGYLCDRIDSLEKRIKYLLERQAPLPDYWFMPEPKSDTIFERHWIYANKGGGRL